MEPYMNSRIFVYYLYTAVMLLLCSPLYAGNLSKRKRVTPARVPSLVTLDRAKKKPSKPQKKPVSRPIPESEVAAGGIAIETKITQRRAELEHYLLQNNNILRADAIVGPEIVAWLPKSLEKSVMSMSMTNCRFTNKHPSFPIGFAITGDTSINGKPATAHLYFIAKQNESTYNTMLELIFGPTTKIADLVVELDQLSSSIRTSPLRAVFASASYTDSLTGIPIPKGFNILMSVSMDSPIFDQVKQFLSYMGKFIQVSNLGELNAQLYVAPLVIVGAIPTRLLIGVPLTFTLDLAQMHEDGQYPFPPAIIESIRFKDTFIFVEPFKMQVGMSSTIAVDLTTEPEPLPFTGIVKFGPGLVSLGAAMDAKWTPIDWLPIQFSQLGIQIDWDLTAAPIMLSGIPFTGLGLRGKTMLGTGPDAIALEAATMVSAHPGQVMTLGYPVEAGFFAHANQLNLASIASVFAQIARVNNANVSFLRDIPLALSNVTIALVPTTMSIASLNKAYGKGIAIEGDFLLGLVRGGIHFELRPFPPELTAQGWLSPINTPIFKLTGSATNGGPFIDIGVSLIDKPHFYMDGTLAIPPLQLSETVHIEADTQNKAFIADLKSKLFGLITTRFTIVMPFSDMKNFDINFDLDIIQFDDLIEGITNEFTKLIKSGGPLSNLIKKPLDVIKKPIEEIEDVIKKPYDTIKKPLKKPLSGLFGKTARTPKSARPVTRSADESAQDRLDIMGDIIPTIKIKKASGSLKSADVVQRKMPSVAMEIEVKLPVIGTKTVSLPRIPFDFDNPVGNARTIAQALGKALVGRK